LFAFYIKKVGAIIRRGAGEMYLIYRATVAHFKTHWSSQANFWAGILGMLVNNSLTLLGIWAMLFAGKTGLDAARDQFLVMNFILMFTWGIIHVFLGGLVELDSQINGGGLDLALATPRNPLLVLSLTSSSLPAWGDLILGLIGIIIFTFQLGPLFLVNAMAIGLFALIALGAVFLGVGSMAFWFRRTEAMTSVILNMCLAFNTYPIDTTGQAGRWMIFLLPLLLLGVMPANYVLNPTWELLAIEAAASIGFLLAMLLVFWVGQKRYQSSAAMTAQRT
jgi:ABC-type uncharacterized transport system permease subunit